MKNDNVPIQTTIAEGEVIDHDTRYGGLSRGKCWGKYYPGQTRPIGDFRWVEKHGGTLYLRGAGYYVIGSSDGFNREARASFCLAAASAPAPAGGCCGSHATGGGTGSRNRDNREGSG